MRAMRLVRVGEPPGFESVELTDPEPGEGEVVVGVVAAALNRRGWGVWGEPGGVVAAALNRRDWWIWREPGAELPVTLGSDAAGVVVAVGGGVDGAWVGDEVVVNSTLGWAKGEQVPSESFQILGAPRDGTFADRV